MQLKNKITVAYKLYMAGEPSLFDNFSHFERNNFEQIIDFNLTQTATLNVFADKVFNLRGEFS